MTEIYLEKIISLSDRFGDDIEWVNGLTHEDKI